MVLEKGLLTGLLAGLLLFYSLRTDVPYPSWLIDLYEEPLIKVFIFSLVFVLTRYDTTIAVLATLVLLFFHTDVSILGLEEPFQSRHGEPIATVFEKQVPTEGTVLSTPFYPLYPTTDEHGDHAPFEK